MSDRVMWQGSDSVTSAPLQAGEAQPRKITADSFRSLTARLKSPAAALEIPDIRPPAAAPATIPLVVAPVDVEVPVPEMARPTENTDSNIDHTAFVPVAIKYVAPNQDSVANPDAPHEVITAAVNPEYRPSIAPAVVPETVSLKDQWTEQVHLPVQPPPVFKPNPSHDYTSPQEQMPASLVIGADRISSILTRSEPADLSSLKLPPILPPPEPPAPKAPELPKAAIESLTTDVPVQAYQRRRLAPSDPELDSVMRMIASLPSLEERAAYLEEASLLEQQQAAQVPEPSQPAEDLEALALQHVAEFEHQVSAEAAPPEIITVPSSENIWREPEPAEPELESFATAEVAVQLPVTEALAEVVATPAEPTFVPDEPLETFEPVETKKNSSDRSRLAVEDVRFESPVAEAQAALVAAAHAKLPNENIKLRKAATHKPTAPRLAAPSHVALDMSDSEIEDLARSLLDMMASGVNAGLPQERALAADTLLRIVPQLQMRPLVHLSDRLAMMESPPHMIVGKLLMDSRIEVSGPLLENGTSIPDQDLFPVIEEGNYQKLRLLARRRKLSRALTDLLVNVDNTSVLLTLVRNTHAEISHEGFLSLTASAVDENDLLAPLCTRADLPAPQAFELFWLAPAQLRRYLLSRFLTDSQTLTKILKITMATQGDRQSSEQFPDAADVTAAFQSVADGNLDDAASKIAAIAQIDMQTAKRIIGDSLGEPLIALLKTLGYPRASLDDLLLLLQRSENGTIDPNRERSELTGLFDTLSFNKARILLTYWDWSTMRSGPYAPVH